MGYFVVIDENGKEISERIQNKFVDCGKVATLDFMFNSVSWLTGSAWYGPRFMGVGNSTNTNDGIVGPTGTTAVSISGSWGQVKGVSPTDYKLSNEITIQRPQLSCSRSGKTVYLTARFTDAHFESGSAVSYDITEFGVFLSGCIEMSGAGYVRYPTANPLYDSSVKQRNNTMMVRAVKSYQSDDINYKSSVITKVPGTDLLLQYVFADFEG